MPIGDQLGIGMAVDILFNCLTAKPCLKGQSFIQFDSMRKPRATFMLAWESSPAGISEGSTFVLGVMKMTVTSCLTQQRWFSLFMRGAENQMGYVSQRNQPLGAVVVAKILEFVEWELEEQEGWIRGDFVKFGAAVALATCTSLRSCEVFLLDLAGLWKYINVGRDSILPEDPLRTGTDLTNAPHVVAALIGEFKGKLGTRHRLLALASHTLSGIGLRKWLERLMDAQAQEGHKSGPAFGNCNRAVGLMADYDGILHYFLRKIQNDFPAMILPSDDIEANYSFNRTFLQTTEGGARAANLDLGVQNAMNRWRKIAKQGASAPNLTWWNTNSTPGNRCQSLGNIRLCNKEEQDSVARLVGERDHNHPNKYQTASGVESL
jgi:hypothetical protein